MKTKTRTVHCENGDHDYERPSQRGQLPRNCPDHKKPPAPVEEAAEEFPVDEYPIICHVEPLPEAAEPDHAALETAGQRRAGHLEMLLKSRGTHLSQQTPICPPLTEKRMAWLDSKPSQTLPSFGFAHGSGAAYDASVAGVQNGSRSRHLRWAAIVREQMAGIAAACRSAGHTAQSSEHSATSAPMAA